MHCIQIMPKQWKNSHNSYLARKFHIAVFVKSDKISKICQLAHQEKQWKTSLACCIEFPFRLCLPKKSENFTLPIKVGPNFLFIKKAVKFVWQKTSCSVIHCHPTGIEGWKWYWGFKNGGDIDFLYFLNSQRWTEDFLLYSLWNWSGQTGETNTPYS